MAYWGSDGLLKPSNLLDAAIQRIAIKPVCACGHSVSFDPQGLWWHFERRGWDDNLRSLRPRFWCIMCRSRKRRKIHPKRLDLVTASAADFVLPLPDERTWKSMMRGIR